MIKIEKECNMRKKLEKLNDDQKEVLLKINVSIMIILMIVVLPLLALNDIEKIRNSYSFIEPCAFIGFMLCAITALIFIYLITHIEFTENRRVSKKIDIVSKSYIEFETNLRRTLEQEKYEREHLIPNNWGCTIKYFIRESNSTFDILLIVHVNDILTEEIRENYMEHSYNYIKEEYPKMEKKAINFVHIICVPKTSNEMRKISEQGIEQATKRYQLAVTVSFSNSKVYIAPAKNYIWSTKYNILKNRILKYLDNQIIKDSE